MLLKFWMSNTVLGWIYQYFPSVKPQTLQFQIAPQWLGPAVQEGTIFDRSLHRSLNILQYICLKGHRWTKSITLKSGWFQQAVPQEWSESIQIQHIPHICRINKSMKFKVVKLLTSSSKLSYDQLNMIYELHIIVPQRSTKAKNML